MSPASASATRNKHSPNGDDNHSPQINVTREEFTRFEQAFKKEEFRKMFLDYCDEIQDPENRKIYEQEIKELEAERGVDVTFLHPQPGFVIKTSVDGSRKCFVNIAKCDQVEKPSHEVAVNPETGKQGLSWALPMAQTQPRDDLDAKGKLCRVFDVVFHPDALRMADRNKAFHKCLVDTALDAVEREYKVKLDRANLKFPKLDFKGVSRPTVIRKLAKNVSAEAQEPHPLEAMFPARPNSDSAKPKVLPTKKTVTKPEFTVPQYRIKHRRNVDLSEFTEELDAKLNITVPRELVVEIDLPLLKSTAECELDVTEKSLYLVSEKPGAKYRLQLDLPYAVDDKKGNATFDIEKRQLRVTLPVVQQSISGQREMHDSLMHLCREDSGVECDMHEDGSSHSVSPVDELNDEVGDGDNNESVTPSTAEPIVSFLKGSIHYQFPAKFDCNVLDNVMAFVLHVRNVQQDSIEIFQQSKNVHLQFATIGSGFYPTYYAFYMQLPPDVETSINSAVGEAWENNIVLNVHLTDTSEGIRNYLAGLDSEQLQEYAVRHKFQVAQKSNQNKRELSPPLLDINVHQHTVEGRWTADIEVRPHLEQQLSVVEEQEDDDEYQTPRGATMPTAKKSGKKQSKKKNKKRRSYSESACDDLKEQQKKHESAGAISTISSVAKSNTTHNTTQQRKQRSYSECRDTMVYTELPPSFKSILKHSSRYDRPVSATISDSSSSIADEDCSSSYSRSVDGEISGSYRGFSQSFSDIPEEQVAADLSDNCKKTVRFSEIIQKQIFKLDSSILGQRKKNQKRRDRKQRALIRRHSEGDSVDYEDNKPAPLHINPKFFNHKSNKRNSEEEDHFAEDNDSDLDKTLTSSEDIPPAEPTNAMETSLSQNFHA